MINLLCHNPMLHNRLILFSAYIAGALSSDLSWYRYTNLIQLLVFCRSIIANERKLSSTCCKTMESLSRGNTI